MTFLSYNGLGNLHVSDSPLHDISVYTFLSFSFLLSCLFSLFVFSSPQQCTQVWEQKTVVPHKAGQGCRLQASSCGVGLLLLSHKASDTWTWVSRETQWKTEYLKPEKHTKQIFIQGTEFYIWNIRGKKNCGHPQGFYTCGKCQNIYPLQIKMLIVFSQQYSY